VHKDGDLDAGWFFWFVGEKEILDADGKQAEGEYEDDYAVDEYVIDKTPPGGWPYILFTHTDQPDFEGVVMDNVMCGVYIDLFDTKAHAERYVGFIGEIVRRGWVWAENDVLSDTKKGELSSWYLSENPKYAVLSEMRAES